MQCDLFPHPVEIKDNSLPPGPRNQLGKDEAYLGLSDWERRNWEAPQESHAGRREGWNLVPEGDLSPGDNISGHLEKKIRARYWCSPEDHLGSERVIGPLCPSFQCGHIDLVSFICFSLLIWLLVGLLRVQLSWLSSTLTGAAQTPPLPQQSTFMSKQGYWAEMLSDTERGPGWQEGWFNKRKRLCCQGRKKHRGTCLQVRHKGKITSWEVNAPMAGMQTCVWLGGKCTSEKPFEREASIP